MSTTESILATPKMDVVKITQWEERKNALEIVTGAFTMKMSKDFKEWNIEIEEFWNSLRQNAETHCLKWSKCVPKRN